jgi:hypothetical protein
VRLDHLLSKEPTASGLSGLGGGFLFSPERGGQGLLIELWNYWLSGCSSVVAGALVLLFGAWNSTVGAGETKRVGRAHCWVLRQHARACEVLGSQGSLVVIPLPVWGLVSTIVSGFSWLVFENCTVDASIFVVQVIKGIR